MILIKTFFTFMFLFLIFSGNLFSKNFDLAQVNREGLDKIENYLKSETNRNMKMYLGEDTRYSLFVRILSNKIKSARTPASNSVDIGYMYVPGIGDSFSAAESFNVQGARIKIFVYDKIKETTIQNLKQIISIIIPELRTNVNFTSLTEPPLMEAPSAPPKPKAIKVPKLFKEHIYENMPALFKFLGTIIMSLLILAGIFLIARALKSGVSAIADSIQAAKLHLKEEHSINDKSSGESGRKGSGSEAWKQELEIATTHKQNSVGHTVDIETEKKIDLIRKTIKNRPDALVNSLSNSSDDLKGLKKLIPLLVSDEEKNLKDSLSDELLSQLEQETGTSNMSGEDFSTWMGEFVEKVIINGLKKGNYFTQILKEEYVRELKKADPQILIQIGKKIDNSLVQKIIMDFIPSNIHHSFLSKFTTEQWKAILTERIPNTTEINDHAQKILEWIEYFKENPGENNEFHLNKVVMNPIIKFINQKDFGEDDKFIDQIAAISPDFAKKVREQVWTPKMLYQIPKSYFSGIVRDLEPDDKFLLAIGLPTDLTQYVLGFIPEGKSKAIITDQINRFRNNPNPEKEQLAKQLCKILIAEIRDDERNGKFKLEDNNTSSEQIQNIRKVA